MKYFDVTGYTVHRVWATVRVKTIRECAEQRAKEKGIVNVTHIEEVKC